MRNYAEAEALAAALAPPLPPLFTARASSANAAPTWQIAPPPRRAGFAPRPGSRAAALAAAAQDEAAAQGWHAAEAALPGGAGTLVWTQPRGAP